MNKSHHQSQGGGRPKLRSRPAKQHEQKKTKYIPIEKIVFPISSQITLLLQRQCPEIHRELDTAYIELQEVYSRLLDSKSSQVVNHTDYNTDLQKLHAFIADIPAILESLEQTNHDQLWHYQRKMLELLQRLHVESKLHLMRISKGYTDSNYGNARKNTPVLENYVHPEGHIPTQQQINNVHHLDKRGLHGPSFPEMLVKLSKTIHETYHTIVDDPDREITYEIIHDTLHKPSHPAKKHRIIGILADINTSINEVSMQRMEDFPQHAKEVYWQINKYIEMGAANGAVSRDNLIELEQIKHLSNNADDFRSSFVQFSIASHLNALPLYLDNAERFHSIERVRRVQEQMKIFRSTLREAFEPLQRELFASTKCFEKVMILMNDYIEIPLPPYQLVNRKDGIDNHPGAYQKEKLLHRGRYSIPELIRALEEFAEEKPIHDVFLKRLLAPLYEIFQCLPTV